MSNNNKKLNNKNKIINNKVNKTHQKINKIVKIKRVNNNKSKNKLKITFIKNKQDMKLILK